jgi:hypothetical protein
MTNETRTMHNFVAAVAPDQVTIEPPRADLIRRQDIVEVTGKMIDGYMTQQRGLLDQVQGETTHNGFLSGADQVRERRKTSGMYLTAYGMVSGLTMGGLTYLGTLAGMDGATALAGWMFGTGALTMLLTWVRHGDEFKHSPEGIARHLLDWHGSIAEYESETRRLSLQWEYDAEERRQAARAQAAEHGRQLAQLRVAELDARRRTIEAQTERRMYAESPQTAIAGVGRTEAPHQVQSIDDAPTGDSTGDGWQAALVQWVASLYAPGSVTDAGVIRTMVPWSARSSWIEGDKAEARRIMCEMRPALIVHDGNRWRLRTEVASNAEQALQVIGQRL